MTEGESSGSQLSGSLGRALSSEPRRPSSPSTTSYQASRSWEAGQPTRDHQELVGIQYARALAAIAVVIDHTAGTLGFPKYFGRPFLHDVLRCGAQGVELFFVLSGFIIVYVSLRADLSPQMGPGKFLRRRFERIVPFMWAAIALYAVARIAGRGSFPVMNYVRAATLFPVGAVDPSSIWTLRHEALFYILFAVCLFDFRRLWPIMAAWFLSPVIYAMTSASEPYSAFAFNNVNILFGLGAVLGCLYLRTPTLWPVSGWAPWALLAVVPIVLAADEALGYSKANTAAVPLLGLACCGCLALGLMAPAARGGWRVLKLLGDASYSIYLIHLMCVSAVIGVLSHRARWIGEPLAFLITVAASLAVGVAVHLVIERRIVRASKAILGSLLAPPRKSGSARRASLVFATAIIVLLSAELAVRLSGAVDVPIFRVDPQIGYYPARSQHGALLHKNTWALNDRSMGVATPYRWTPDGVLLVGDSVVYCGNPCRQPEKLGPVLSAVSHRPVWPIAAGGWALDNELQMLKANPDLLKLPTLVWVSNTGDLGAENAWTNPVNYPNHRPVSALLYLARKTVLKPHDVVDSPPSPEATAKWQVDLRAFLAAYHGRLIWVLYPKTSEIGRSMPKFAPLLKTLAGRARIVDVSRSPAWRSSFYRDGIHPNPQGDRVLAEVIASAL